MATSLLDWIIDLMRDGSAREAFNANPQAEMASAGFTNVCGDDVADSRAFLFDNTSIKEVKGVDKDFDNDSDAPDQIKYIVNNYTFEAPELTPQDPDTIVDVPDGPDEDGPEIDQSENEGGTNTATVSEDETTTEASTEAEDGNAVSGDDSAGEDLISGELENISGDDNVNVLTFTDLIDIEESPFLNDVLNNSLNDVINVLDLVP